MKRPHVVAFVSPSSHESAGKVARSNRGLTSLVKKGFNTTSGTNFQVKGARSDTLSSSGTLLHMTPESSTVFEPVINTPALAAFVFIAITFSLLQLRINTVSHASERRKVALANLRQIKSDELSREGVDRPTSEQISTATALYKQAIEDEERLRTIIPGVRIAAPNTNLSTDDISAVKQFLGEDLPQTTADQDEKTATEMSPFAIAILVVVGISQLALLYLLTFDPMAAPISSF